MENDMLFWSGDHACRPTVPKHQWRRTNMRRAGYRSVTRAIESVWTLVPVRLGKQLSDNSTVDEIASEAADCRLTYTMANCSQRRKGEKRKENEKKKEKSSKRRGLVVLGSGEENPRVLFCDADQESKMRMRNNALRTGPRQAVDASSSRVRKRVSKGNFPRLEQCLVSWMRQSRGQNIPMGGFLLKEKAKAFAKELRIEFSASEGWLTNFKKRNGEALPEQDLTFDVLVDTDIAVWGALSDAEIVALDHNNTESDEEESEELTPVTLSGV
ncbi:uncharacterized protein TNCV_966811 [Trichonephila clavipes]|nr:uncharacterized protein TNCV_966811 [Trichonephila clavipes]